MPARILLLVVASVGFAGVVNAEEPLEAFLTKHCLRCHGPDNEEGELRIDQLSRDFNSGVDTQHWAEVIERINAGEMPPEDEPRPTQEEISAFVTRLDARIKEGKAARMAARPPVAHYRLSRKEYQNTVYDLLGVRYDPTAPGELNEDQLWHGYERIGSELSLSVSHVDRYYRAAQTVLDRAFPAEPVKTQDVRRTAAEIRYRGGEEQREWLERLGIERPLRYLINPGFALPSRDSPYRAFAELVRRRGPASEWSLPHASPGQRAASTWRSSTAPADRHAAGSQVFGRPRQRARTRRDRTGGQPGDL